MLSELEPQMGSHAAHRCEERGVLDEANVSGGLTCRRNQIVGDALFRSPVERSGCRGFVATGNRLERRRDHQFVYLAAFQRATSLVEADDGQAASAICIE